MMHAEAPHPNCAYKWMEALLAQAPGRSRRVVRLRAGVLDGLQKNELLGPEGCDTNGLGNFDKIHFWRTPVAKCATQEECVPYYRWVTDYIAVLGGR